MHHAILLNKPKICEALERYRNDELNEKREKRLKEEQEKQKRQQELQAQQAAAAAAAATAAAAEAQAQAAAQAAQQQESESLAAENLEQQPQVSDESEQAHGSGTPMEQSTSAPLQTLGEFLAPRLTEISQAGIY